MYTTVIFDLDGTLIDSDYFNMKSLQKAILNVEGRDLPFDEVKRFSGAPGMTVLDMLGVKKVDETFKEWDEEFFRMKGRADYFEGMEDTLTKLKEKDIFIGIVTSREESEYEAFFSHLNLYEKFDRLVFSSDTVNHKPHPEPLLKFLELSGKEKKGAIYIGDTVFDRDAAMNAGIDFALAGWSLHDVKCDIVLEKPKDILDMV